MHRNAPTLAALLVVAACGADTASEADAASGVTVRDSAGIRIVENHDSAWTEETRWRLTDEPEYVIGSLDGSVPGTDFGRFVTPHILGARTIVLDTSNDDVRLFDEEGGFVETLVHRGEGPVEVMGASRIRAYDDSVVLVWDNRAQKVVRVDLVGDSVSSTSTGDPPGEPTGGLRIGGMSSWAIRGWLTDESYIVTEGITMMSGRPPGRSVDSTAWHRISTDGDHLSEIGRFPSREFWSDDESSVGMAFTATGTVVPRDSTVVQAFPSDGFEFVERRTDGAPKMIVRASIPRVPVTDRLMSALQAREQASMADLMEGSSPALREMRERTAELQASRPWPDSVAPFSTLMTTPSGHILAVLSDPEWLARPVADEGEAETRTYQYVVFDPDGRWLGTLEAPAGLSVTDVGNDALIGFRRDEFDVPYIERWSIIKP